MKYKGADAPRNLGGDLIWNTDYDYSATGGFTITQNIRQAYGTNYALATFLALAATAKANGSTSVSMKIVGGEE